MKLFNDKSFSGALFSDCMNYRYRLWRIWDESLPKILFIMLNPSTADENKLDPTCTRCMNKAKNLGYGGFFVGNVFAYRSTDPKGLQNPDNPIEAKGDSNLEHLIEMHNESELTICAWGNHAKDKRSYITDSITDLNYLKLNHSGEPSHPLYLPESLKPETWRGL